MTSIVTTFVGPSLDNNKAVTLPASQNESLFVGRIQTESSGMTDLDQGFRSSSFDTMKSNGWGFSSWIAADAWKPTSTEQILFSFGEPHQTPQAEPIKK